MFPLLEVSLNPSAKIISPVLVVSVVIVVSIPEAGEYPCDVVADVDVDAVPVKSPTNKVDVIDKGA